MTQREFGVGDEIEAVMGDERHYPANAVASHDDMHMVRVEINMDGRIETFLFSKINGKCPNFPGLSIRHADEVITTPPKRIADGKVGEPVTLSSVMNTLFPPTKQEWVKGQAPEDKSGWFYVNYKDTGVNLVLLEEGEERWHTHYMKADIQLPPPPPVDEVEAYGMLVFCNNIIGDDREISLADSIVICKAARFYNLPATAENLEKYLRFETYDSAYDDPSATIDYIIVGHKRYPNSNLIFTAAALEALGVK